MESLLGDVTQHLRAIRDMAKQRAQLTASATTAGGRVTVTVNADCVVIATRFSSDIDDLSYDDIANAMTQAAQKAAAEMARKSQELIEPLAEQRATMMKLPDLLEDAPDLNFDAPSIPASLAPPHRRDAESQTTSAADEYADAVDYDDWANQRGGITDTGR
ncbi:YbaB/EbfC family nucleoid-associated protein [Nocardia sp. NPDC050406]|uniref:YbaB/EbfC family nucleoid-associated protein n=1 Tax=Nocardia sp. NPDC050406 TaxID=3364318 RepID=UPI0037A1B41C